MVDEKVDGCVVGVRSIWEMMSAVGSVDAKRGGWFDDLIFRDTTTYDLRLSLFDAALVEQAQLDLAVTLEQQGAP